MGSRARQLLRTVPTHAWAAMLLACAVALLPPLLQHTLAPGIQIIPLGVVWQEIAAQLDLPVFILALAYLSASLDDSGFYRLCAHHIMRWGRGHGPTLLVGVFLGVSALTYVTSNDIVILSMTPIVFHLGRCAGFTDLTPILITQFFAANTASMGLYIGNPTNIVIGGAVGMGFSEYAERMLVPTAASLIATFVVLFLVFTRWSRNHRVAAQYAQPARGTGPRWSREMTLKVTGVGLCLVALAISGSPAAPAGAHDAEAPLDARHLMMLITLAFAFVALGHDALRERQRKGAGTLHALGARVRRLPFEIIPVVLGLSIVVRGLQAAGLTDAAAEGIVHAFERGPVLGALATGFSGVAAVNVLNNIPATLLFGKIWSGSHAATASAGALVARLDALGEGNGDLFVESALVASNVGANLSFMGALAGLMWLRILDDMSKQSGAAMRVPGARHMLAYGCFVVPIATASPCILIGLLR